MSQYNTNNLLKKVLTDASKEELFSGLTNTTPMPKNNSRIVGHHYVPILVKQTVTERAKGAIRV